MLHQTAWLLLGIFLTVDALLPVVSHRSNHVQLTEEMEDELLASNLYGEQNGYVIPVHHLAKGIFRLDLSSWMDGSVFDYYSRSIQEELNRELHESENLVGEFDFLRKALKENLYLQRELLKAEVNQDLKEYKAVVPGRTRKTRNGPVVVVFKQAALAVLSYLFQKLRMLFDNSQDDMEQWRKETHIYLQEHLFRTRVHLVMSKVREDLRGNFKTIMEDLLLENKLNEQLFNEAEDSLDAAVENLLGHDYGDSVFAKFHGKGLHAIRAFVISIDIQRKHLDIQVEVPVALMRNIYPMVHIVDLGSFNDNGSSFELDILPAKYFYRDSLSQWNAVGGPCIPIANLFICENVLLLDGNCQLNLTRRSDCRRDRLPAENTSTFVRRMTQAYVVATNEKQGVIHNDAGVESSVQFTAPVFYARIFGGQELVIGEHRLKGLSDIGRFTVRFGPGHADPPELEESQELILETEASPQFGGYLQSTGERPGEVATNVPTVWLFILTAVVVLLSIALICSHISLSRRISTSYSRIDRSSTTSTVIKDLPCEYSGEEASHACAMSPSSKPALLPIYPSPFPGPSHRHVIPRRQWHRVSSLFDQNESIGCHNSAAGHPEEKCFPRGPVTRDESSGSILVGSNLTFGCVGSIFPSKQLPSRLLWKPNNPSMANRRQYFTMNEINMVDLGEPGGSTKEEKYSLNFFNERSRVQHLDDEDTLVFYFDYKKPETREGENAGLLGNKENVDWRVLRYLKQKNKWGVMRHPMVLNFINERLLDCALFYTLHIVAFALFLLLLSSHIFARTTLKDWAVTAFLFFFTLMMLLKGAVKARLPQNRVSFWFVIACAFNFLTYVATFCYVWLPTVFSYDNYHQEIKNIIVWFLPIVAIISAWMNFLYILRKSPYGIYIFMMVRILRSFGHIATIWIPTLIAFSFAFHLIMRDSGIEPWESVDKDTNATMVTKLFVILQAITKTSTMMIGEVDANDILGTRQWIPSILVLAFEIITVILLMNLMVSLAVGDVSDLRNTAQDKLLKIKVNFVIEALQLSEIYSIPGIVPLHQRPTNNILVVDNDGAYHTLFREDVTFGQGTSPAVPYRSYERGIGLDKSFNVNFLNPGMKMRVRPLHGRPQAVYFKNCAVELLETTDSNIAPFQGKRVNIQSEDGLYRRYCKWIIGLDWTGYLDL